MREGAARAEAGDSSALPAVVGPPVEHRPAHQRGTQVAGRRRIDREGCRRDRRGRAGVAGERQRGRRRAGKRAAGRLLEGGDGLAVGQVVQACPAHQHVGPAVAHLELEQLVHLVLVRRRIVALGARGAGHETLFAILLVARANNLNVQSFRCHGKALALRPRKGQQRSISRIFYVNIRWLRRPGPWRAGAEAVTKYGFGVFRKLSQAFAIYGSQAFANGLAQGFRKNS